MSKFSRVARTLPVGVSTETSGASHVELPFNVGILQFAKHFEKTTSNFPISLQLEVPEGAEAETAKLLRQMADELSPSTKGSK